MDIAHYKEDFLNYLKAEIIKKDPINLYLPIEYILELGGKRLRPILVLLSCDLFNEDHNKAMEAALCLEMFHNFTLLHDDIMDKADLRRGKETVHKKWNVNTGILSGDALMILAYQRLEYYDGEKYKNLMSLFNKMALEVCEGQQLDVDFEELSEVPLDTYIKMISYKTAVLVGTSLRMGSVIAGATIEDQLKIYNFGLNLGIAFQLQDDYLDTFGNEDFGKKIGGDILEGKKTFLYIKALELANDEDRFKLLELYENEQDEASKIAEVKKIFLKNRLDALLTQQIEHYTLKAFEDIEGLSIENSKKLILKNFGLGLMNRKT